MAGVALLLCVMGIGTLFVLLDSLAPSESAYANAPAVKLPALSAGQFQFVDDPYSFENSPSRLMLVRRLDGSLKVWRVPIAGDAYRLPDFHWWQSDGPLCRQLAPDFRSGIVSCGDHDSSGWAFTQARWDLNGKNLTGQLDDMMEVRGQARSGYFYFSLTY